MDSFIYFTFTYTNTVKYRRSEIRYSVLGWFSRLQEQLLNVHNSLHRSCWDVTSHSNLAFELMFHVAMQRVIHELANRSLTPDASEGMVKSPISSFSLKTQFLWIIFFLRNLAHALACQCFLRMWHYKLDANTDRNWKTCSPCGIEYSQRAQV